MPDVWTPHFDLSDKEKVKARNNSADVRNLLFSMERIQRNMVNTYPLVSRFNSSKFLHTEVDMLIRENLRMHNRKYLL